MSIETAEPNPQHAATMTAIAEVLVEAVHDGDWREIEARIEYDAPDHAKLKVNTYDAESNRTSVKPPTELLGLFRTLRRLHTGDDPWTIAYARVSKDGDNNISFKFNFEYS